MIVKRYIEPARFQDPRKRAGAAAERQMAHYLESSRTILRFASSTS